MILTKLTETSTSITLGWTPPSFVECYGFFANGQKVSMADDKNKDGSPRNSVKYSKTSPGPPYTVVALVRSGTGFAVEWATYPVQAPNSIYPSSGRYPSEVI